jgi:hypothetical protein
MHSPVRHGVGRGPEKGKLWGRTPVFYQNMGLNMGDIVTLKGLAPRQPFQPKIKDGALDELRAMFVFSHHQYLVQAANYIAHSEGIDKAITVLLDVVADLQKQRAM